MSRYGPQIQWTGKPHRVPLLSFHCFIIFYNCQPRYSLSELLPENPTVFLQYNMEEYQIRNISRNQQTNQGLFIIYGRGGGVFEGGTFFGKSPMGATYFQQVADGGTFWGTIFLKPTFCTFLRGVANLFWRVGQRGHLFLAALENQNPPGHK